MNNKWEFLEIILKKPLEEIIDIAGNWKCKPCNDKLKYISKDSIYEALKEKINSKNVQI